MKEEVENYMPVESSTDDWTTNSLLVATVRTSD